MTAIAEGLNEHRYKFGKISVLLFLVWFLMRGSLLEFIPLGASLVLAIMALVRERNGWMFLIPPAIVSLVWLKILLLR